MPEASQLNDSRTIYRVSELNTAVHDLLESSFPLLWIEGEISNLARPRSGHWYFSLKDEAAQVRCAMFRNKNRLAGFIPEDGAQLLVRAKVSLYPARGDYQLIIEHMEPAGDGALRRAYEQLKHKLGSQGLFDEAQKRQPPATPRRIGLITSPTGAAMRDVLSVLRRRFPLTQVLLHPVPVQGAAAAPAIVRALETAGRRGDCDVLLLVRGGGSLEDLWAFNEESVARAIRACPIPLISGIGHETDFSIADFAADVRAPTPSVAAELACPDQADWVRRLTELRLRLTNQLRSRLQAAGHAVQSWDARLQRLHPQRRLQQQMQRCDELELRLHRSLRNQLRQRRSHLASLNTQLQASSPRNRLSNLHQQLDHQRLRLTAAADKRIERAHGRLGLASRGLNTVSPLNTLERGYAIAQTQTGKLLTQAAALRPGDALHLRLHRGRLDCRVESSYPADHVIADNDKL